MCRAQALRVKDGDGYLPFTHHIRPDVTNVYGVPLEDCTGWTVQFPSGVAVEVQVNTGDEWGTVFVLKKDESLQPTYSKHAAPTFLVIDNFYEHPDQVRAFALSCKFLGESKYHKGSRTASTYRFPGLKERFPGALAGAGGGRVSKPVGHSVSVGSTACRGDAEGPGRHP